ncbi:1,4-alpha-glucan branching protein GlgB [Gulosibacter molinativorax]|uniref:1,4-alpha-glucan branching enzyme GlgB n=1 Tax=Gulosibacter molinativorax TaxID=256821 RepID=A0ABT7CBX1_9MICO|nr:1,4-alpha-glucan branching protein GlgB [Gulosibacter molinativorax]MDJ1372645.1 1,4-alpha-glucan branching protein GlgB [Gulosibacter molinativorax]QUY60767.1 1,4-alpha-glucan branching enzyme GlgB [Gulosibacter molinativorax]
MNTPVSEDHIFPDAELLALAEGHHSGPHGVLGQHPLDEEGTTAVRVRRPLAKSVRVVLEASGRTIELEHLAHGIWSAVHNYGLDDYVIETTYEGGETYTTDDPYRFMPSVGDTDIYLFGEGRHEQLWKVFGAHVREHYGTHKFVQGTSFAVWAPHARAVRVVGSFNSWDGAQHAMRRLNERGVWELFIPGLGAHETYKFQILSQDGMWIDKADPMALHAERPPHTASVIAQPSQHEWGDGEWLAHRASTDPHNQPMSVYELHAMSWRPGLGYRELADELITYLNGMQFTHVEFMPLAEHPFGGSWGYQVTGYYAPTSRLGSPDDLRYLIDRLHQAGYGVIMDWVPGHFPKDAFGLAEFDGQALYEHPDPRLGHQADWGTYVFNFGDSQVRNFLVANALYWLEEFHIDGLRVDAVASIIYRDYSRDEWLPNKDGGREYYEAIDFLQEVNATAYKLNPGIVMIAEESTSYPGVTRATDEGGLGFGLKWNMGWMNDNLRYIAKDPIYRKWHQGDLTFSFVYAWSEQYILPISHDEVVHGKGSMFSKMPGDDWQKAANMRLFYSYQWGHPGKQLLFMGQEFGQPSEWSEDKGLDWWLLENDTFSGIQRYVAALNNLYRSTPAMWELDNDPAGLQWISGDDSQNSLLAFVRRDRSGGALAAVFNFSNHSLEGYELGLPSGGAWDEVLNSDDLAFGGSGVTNDTLIANGAPAHGHGQSVSLRVPPLGATFLRRR